MSRTTGALALTGSLLLALAAAPAVGQDAEPSCDPLAADSCPPSATSATTDPELEAMFPTAITGADGIRVESQLFAVVLAQLEEDDPEQAAAATEQLGGLVGPLGRSVDELAHGEGAFRIGDGADAIVGRIEAWRLPGADAAAMVDLLLEVAGLADAERAQLRIADRDVTVVSPDGRDQYLYAAGDVIWNIYQQGGSGLPEETLAEIVSQLPQP